jgi:hypothetical protein
MLLKIWQVESNDQILTHPFHKSLGEISIYSFHTYFDQHQAFNWKEWSTFFWQNTMNRKIYNLSK